MKDLDQVLYYAGEDITHLFVVVEVYFYRGRLEMPGEPRDFVLMKRRHGDGQFLVHCAPGDCSLQELKEAIAYLVDHAIGIPHPTPKYEVKRRWFP